MVLNSFFQIMLKHSDSVDSTYRLRKNPLNIRNFDGTDLILSKVDRLGKMAENRRPVSQIYPPTHGNGLQIYPQPENNKGVGAYDDSDNESISEESAFKMKQPEFDLQPPRRPSPAPQRQRPLSFPNFDSSNIIPSDFDFNLPPPPLGTSVATNHSRSSSHESLSAILTKEISSDRQEQVRDGVDILSMRANHFREKSLTDHDLPAPQAYAYLPSSHSSSSLSQLSSEVNAQPVSNPGLSQLQHPPYQRQQQQQQNVAGHHHHTRSYDTNNYEDDDPEVQYISMTPPRPLSRASHTHSRPTTPTSRQSPNRLSQQRLSQLSLQASPQRVASPERNLHHNIHTPPRATSPERVSQYYSPPKSLQPRQSSPRRAAPPPPLQLSPSRQPSPQRTNLSRQASPQRSNLSRQASPQRSVPRNLSPERIRQPSPKRPLQQPSVMPIQLPSAANEEQTSRPVTPPLHPPQVPDRSPRRQSFQLELKLASPDLSSLMSEISDMSFSANPTPQLNRKNTITSPTANFKTSPSKTAPAVFERMRSLRRSQSRDQDSRRNSPEKNPVDIKQSVPTNLPQLSESTELKDDSVVDDISKVVKKPIIEKSAPKAVLKEEPKPTATKPPPLSFEYKSLDPDAPRRLALEEERRKEEIEEQKINEDSEPVYEVLGTSEDDEEEPVIRKSPKIKSPDVSIYSYDSHIVNQLCAIPSPIINAISFTPPVGAVESDDEEISDMESIFSGSTKGPKKDSDNESISASEDSGEPEITTVGKFK